MLLRSFYRVLDKISDVQLVIAGTGESKYISYLKMLAESFGISNNIIWCGMISGQQKKEMLQRAAVCVVPSRVDSYSFVVLESMASGTPLVVSDRVGLADKVNCYGVGLVTELDPESLAEAICRILDDRSLSDGMSHKGPSYIAEHYDWSQIVLKFEQLYESLL